MTESKEPTVTPEPVPASEHAGADHSDEKSILHKIGAVGDDAVKRLREIIAEVDRDEFKKNLNRENIQRSIAATLDTLNTKAQLLLAPKGETHHEKGEPRNSVSEPGPVGAEVLHTEPESPTSDITGDTNA